MRTLGVVIVLAACGPESLPAGYLARHPNVAETVWSEDAQGVAHDGRHWYFSDQWSIFRYPVTDDPGGDGFIAVAGLPPDCDHVGDIDHQSGRVYAPIELCGGGRPNRLYVFDAETLSVVTWAVVPQAYAPWVAVHPDDGTIWSSDIDSRTVNVYAPTFETGRPLTLLRRLDLGGVVDNIQGGAFSPDGRLYLVSDDHDRPERAGVLIHEVDGERARRVGHIPPPAGYPGGGAELEGITIWDLDAVDHRHASLGGQVHWLLLDNDGLFDRDDVSLEHFRLQPPPP
jgi:hypothetical protein